jgi:ABC-type multidrug transport system ATPase subunit
MEEAEVLSDRIGIIIKGQLQCLGTQYKLRKVYGKGFKLTINLCTYDVDLESDIDIEESFKNSQEFIHNLFPSSKVSEKYKSTLIFQVFYINPRFQMKSLMQKNYSISLNFARKTFKF